MLRKNSQTRVCLAVRVALLTALVPGCAIHYFDQKTGTEHLWGIGHMKVKVSQPSEGLQAVVRGVDVIGVGGGRVADEGYLALGWQSQQRMDILNEDTSIRLEWCGSDFANVRVGSEFPDFMGQPKPEDVHMSSQKEETKE